MNQSIDRSILATIRAICEEDEEHECMGELLYESLKAQPLTSGWTNWRLGSRVLILYERGLVGLSGHRNSSDTIAAVRSDYPSFVSRVTAAGEDELSRPEEEFGRPKQTAAVSSFHLGPVTGAQVNVGTHVQGSQTQNIEITLGQAIQGLQSAIEESAEVPPEKKQEAQSLLAKLKDTLGAASSSVTVYKFLVGL